MSICTHFLSNCTVLLRYYYMGAASVQFLPCWSQLFIARCFYDFCSKVLFHYLYFTLILVTRYSMLLDYALSQLLCLC